MTRQKTKKSSPKQAAPAHDHSSEIKRINRIKGQIEGMERMIVQKRYCPEIVIQIKAIRSALKSLEANIIENHMHHCVKDAIKSKDSTVVQQKLDEIISLFKSQN